jgi:ATP-dependent exoDNAse (exonuclease V) alpha subunit
VTVYEPAEREFSIGERVQFTAPQKQLGIANREMGTIEKVCHDGNITLRLEDARTIEFSATVHPHFDHGYAVTSHSAQGLTADRVLINADTKAHPDLLSSRFAYVSVSRARRRAPYDPQRSTWFKIRNKNYSQLAGREELFERERHAVPVPGWHTCALAASGLD